jgi:hypothetical protein
MSNPAQESSVAKSISSTIAAQEAEEQATGRRLWAASGVNDVAGAVKSVTGKKVTSPGGVPVPPNVDGLAGLRG